MSRQRFAALGVLTVASLLVIFFGLQEIRMDIFCERWGGRFDPPSHCPPFIQPYGRS